MIINKKYKNLPRYKIMLQKSLQIVRDMNVGCTSGKGEGSGTSGINKWLLIRHYWDDEGEWVDTEYWID